VPGVGPTWVQHVIWWQVYPLGFTGAEPQGDPGGPVRQRLDRIVDWLNYAVELGASGVALGPVFASHTHGYDTVDYLRIDPRLGDADTFTRLVEAAHTRGLRVLLDGVFNHVGRGFPVFARVLAQGPSAAEADWFQLTWPDGAPAGTEPDYATFEGHGELVALNHHNPAVVDHVVTVMNHWLDAGADGWRLDAAYAVPEAFWAQVLPQVRERHPDAYIVGEVIHGDYPAFVRASGVDAVTQYELWKAIWSALADRNLFELDWNLKRHATFLETFVPLTFVGNHDVTRIASTLPAPLLPHALAILFLVGGTPSVYYGDEQAFHGVKEQRAGGDDAIRPAFPADGPTALSPLGRPIYRLHQELIGLRRRHPWLHTARTTAVELQNTQAVLESRSTQADHRLRLALNLHDAPAELPVPHAVQVLAGPGTLRNAAGPDATVTLDAHGWAVLGDEHAGN
jgi:cyclomaltodextrinase / maltogenic alpha-amylase / neopullulanase